MYSIQIHKTITAIEPAEWDRLADDAYIRYGWLKTVEETFIPPVHHRYFIIAEDGHLVGAAVCGIHQPTDKVFTLDDHFFGRFKDLMTRFHFSMLPALICGPLRGYGQHFILDQNLTVLQRDTVAQVLLDTIEQEAKRRHLSIGFINVLDEEYEIKQLLKGRGYGKTVHLPMSYLDIAWESFEDYKNMLSRRKLTYEINKNRREGVTIRKLDNVETHQDRLYALLQMNNRKHNKKPMIMRKDFFSRCRQNMGGDVDVFIAEKKGCIIGVVALFHHRGVGYLSDVGVDHETAGNDFTYFNLVFYHPVYQAIAMRLRRICLGVLFYRMKARRGYATMNTYIYFKSKHRLMRAIIGPLLIVHTRIKSWFIKRLLN